MRLTLLLKSVIGFAYRARLIENTEVDWMERSSAWVHGMSLESFALCSMMAGSVM